MNRPMNRRGFLATLGAATAATAFAPFRSPAAEDTPLNVVFFLIDDLGWTDVGCYGSTFYDTPNVDRLARTGMRFTDGYAACTVCSPTRASIMTGKYPARIHLTDWISGHVKPYAKLRIPQWTQFLPLEEISLAEALEPRGYVNGFIGKWHLGPTQEYWPLAQGFDENVGGYSRGAPPSYFAPYRIPTMKEGPKGEYLTDRHAADAEAFLETHAGSPFLLYLSMYAVHTPLQAKKELIEKYRKRAGAKPASKQNNPVYGAMIESMDQCVGRVLRKLDDLGLSERTIVIFTGDNGGLIGNPKRPVTSNAPLRAGKGSVYEGGVREPFIIRWPGVTRPGSICRVPVMTIDLYPTILEMTGAKGDAEHNREVDGVSLVPLLRGGSSLARDALYWHYPHYHPGGATPYSAIREGNLKLIEFHEDSRLELFDLANDIGEMTNLANAQADVASRLRAKLHAWRERVGAQMPTPNPDYDPDNPGRGKGVDRKNRKHPAFAVLKGGNIRKTPFGWELKTKGEATALRRLPEPITGKATFTLKVHTLRKREDGWQNGFLALASSTKDKDLLVAGIYIGGLRVSVFDGLSTHKGQETVAGATFNRREVLPITVEVDVPKRSLRMTAAGESVTHELPAGMDAVRFAGYHAIQTATDFSEIELR